MSGNQHTFVFADLAGFTALTETHGDEHAADIALEFCAELNRVLPVDAEDLKMLGDACLVRVGGAADAVGLGLALAELAPHYRFPRVRVGMHTGTAVSRGKDWFGATLNIAARIAELAGPNDVLLSASTARAAGPIQEILLEDRGTHQLRHVSEPVHLWRAHRSEPARQQPDSQSTTAS